MQHRKLFYFCVALVVINLNGNVKRLEPDGPTETNSVVVVFFCNICISHDGAFESNECEAQWSD